MKHSAVVFFLLIAFIYFTCSKKEEHKIDALFSLIPSDSSGIYFSNDIAVSDSINILSYEYLYNGGGVGIGDFNNDGLPDVFFTGNNVPCRLYINKGNFKFEDITTATGIDTKEVWAYGVSVADVNQDGWSDIYISAGGIGNKDIFHNKLYINKGNLTFEESADEYGLSEPGESIQAGFFDYDKDGDLDMYQLIGGGFEKSAIIPRPIIKDGSGRNTDRLYKNDFNKQLGHAVFTNVSKEAGILEEGFGLGVCILDINEDGWLDVYITNDYLTNDLLYVNNQDGTFTEESSNYFKHTSHFAMGNDVGDINNDGLMDIVALDMLPEDHYRRKLMFGPNQYDRFYFGISQGYSYQYMRNTLQLNNGNGSFSEIGQMAGIYKTDWSWSVLLADFDNDEYQDIFITNGFGKDVTDLDFVKFRNKAPNLMDRETFRKAFTDSLAVRPEIKVPNYAYKNNRDFTFKKITEAWGFDIPSLSNGMAYADLDLDGDLDLVINNINQEAFLYKNKLVEKRIPNTNYLRIKLNGPIQNKTAIGSKVILKYSGKKQVRFLSTIRGFESSIEDIIHVGLGPNKMIDTLRVIWNDGRISELTKVRVNQVLTVDHSNSVIRPFKDHADKTLLASLNNVGIEYKHEENEFNDFNYESLLQHKLSNEGPGIAMGDINEDGLEDAFVGGAYHQAGSFFIQQKNGKFKTRKFSTEDDASEDMGCLLFDADDDNDLDLYVVSGGNEYSKDHQRYQDRLYKNDGTGNFLKDKDALPSTVSSGSCVVAADYDQDGDLDLFVGGRSVPREYPTSPRSYLLQNEGGKFIDVTEKIAPELKNVGMVTGALWTDADNDNKLDLMLVGEWMPITLFKNESGKFKNTTANVGLKDTDGLWKSLVSADFDNDGDMDYVAGNLGLNSPFFASTQEPMTVSYADFDNNGSIDPIIAYYENGISYPFPSLDMMTQRMPSLKKKILYYRTYAAATTESLLKMTGKTEYDVLYCKTLQTTFIENLGNGNFKIKPLPLEAQIAPVYGMLAEDINGDGNLDLLAVGNSYSTDVVTGRYDALIGLTLLGDGKNNFKNIPAKKSGFFVDGDGKGIAQMESSTGGSIIWATQNSDSIKLFKLYKEAQHTTIHPMASELFATLTMKNGKRRKIELNYGSAYLSQSSRCIHITPESDTLKFYNRSGKVTRTFR